MLDQSNRLCSHTALHIKDCVVGGGGDRPSADQHGIAPGGPLQQPTFAEEHVRHRREGNMFCANNLRFTIHMLRLNMEAPRVLMNDMFYLASPAFELNEQCRAAAARAAGGSDLSSRKYRAAIAAEGVLEEKFFSKLRMLFVTGEMWDVMPPDSATEANNGLAFRLLSRQGALVYESLYYKHARSVVIFCGANQILKHRCDIHTGFDVLVGVTYVLFGVIWYWCCCMSAHGSCCLCMSV